MVAFLFVCMFILGFSDSIRGPLLPAIRSFFGISYTAMGTLMAIATGAFLVGSLVAGPVLRRLGSRNTIRTGIVLLAAGLLLVGSATSTIVLGAGYLVLGFGGGFMELALNGTAGRALTRRPGLMMNLLHLLFGVGATVGPLCVGILLARDYSWDSMYRYTVLFPIVALLVSLFLGPQVVKPPGGASGPRFSGVLRDPRVVSLSVALGFFVALELGVATWLANFLVEARGAESTVAAASVAWFYGLFSASRLLLGALTDRIGFHRVIGFGAVSASAIIAVGVLVPGASWILVASGIPVALLFPTVMAHIAQLHGEEMELVMAVAVTTAGLINLASNVAVGALHEWLGTEIGFLSIALFGVVGFGVHRFARRVEIRF